MDAIELEAAGAPFEPVDDKRPKMDEPPPVRLVAVEDCTLHAAAGMEKGLDDFYVDLLGFWRDEEETQIVYRAEKHRIRFVIDEVPVPREDYRHLGVQVPSLAEIVQRLTDAGVEMELIRGMVVGSDALLVRDPAGNPLEICEFRIAI